MVTSRYKPFSQYLARNVDAATLAPGTTLEGTAASRRVLAETAVTLAPSANDDGFSIVGAEKLIIKLKAAVRDYSVVLWEWDASSEEWALNSVVGTQSLTAGTTLLFGAEVDGSHRAVLQVTAASGAGGTIDGWGRLILRPRG